jgi:anaerobic ribonucleoside-triphosphate reductase
MPKWMADLHRNNEIYIHDLDHYALGDHNCLSVPFDKLLANGFNTRQTDVRPANSVNTAFQLVAVIFQLQSLNQFGGVSATHLDWTMVPYVRKSFYKHFKDGLTYIENVKWVESNYNDESIAPKQKIILKEKRYWTPSSKKLTVFTKEGKEDAYYYNGLAINISY